MPTTRILRNLAFILLVGVCFTAFQSDVLGAFNLSTFCFNWDRDYDCGDCPSGGFPPAWVVSGSCDFSDEEEPELLGAAYCYDEWEACTADCEWEYPYYLADYYESRLPETDPCYEAATDPQCWWTWAQGGCEAGPESTWTCSCSRWLVCECGDR